MLHTIALVTALSTTGLFGHGGKHCGGGRMHRVQTCAVASRPAPAMLTSCGSAPVQPAGYATPMGTAGAPMGAAGAPMAAPGKTLPAPSKVMTTPGSIYATPSAAVPPAPEVPPAPTPVAPAPPAAAPAPPSN